MTHILHPGSRQVAAGYVVYGSSTVLAYTAGEGVHMFTLDPSIGAYLLARENLRMPETGRIYSVNEAYRGTFPERIQRYLDWAKETGNYSSRYIGSLVADFHRTLIRGGVFLYPGTKKSPKGKLRLLYEANPLAFVAEQAGGVATDGHQRILDKQPTDMHERTALIIGSKDEVHLLALAVGERKVGPGQHIQPVKRQVAVIRRNRPGGAGHGHGIIAVGGKTFASGFVLVILVIGVERNGGHWRTEIIYEPAVN